MSDRYLLAYLLALHGVLLAGGFFFLRERPGLLFGLEGVLAVSLVVGLALYRRRARARRLLRDGTAALRDQDYSLRLREVGVRDVDELIGVYNDLLARIRDERLDSQRQQFFLGLLVEATTLGVVTMDFDGGLAELNGWGRRQLGLSPADALPATLAEVDHPLARALAELADGERRVVRLSGNLRYRIESASFIDRGFARRFAVVNNLSGELTAAEVAAYGKVIRMMAHEVNNTAAATRSLLQSLIDTDDLGDADFRALAREYLPLLVERGDALNAFMQRFADVVRLPEPDLRDLDLASLLRRQSVLNRPECERAGITLTEALTPTHIRGDGTLLAQVVSNAIVNARESLASGVHASGSKSAKVIEVRTRSRPPGFEIRDNGPGIAPHDRAVLFTPFFSSKPTGQGIGLTLARDVLDRHGARYGLRTDDDGWTSFWVEFDVAA